MIATLGIVNIQIMGIKVSMTQQITPQQKPRKERKENADRRRQQLIQATLKSIATNGLAKTTLATVANEAGLSQGVAVFYFKSKTGLLSGALHDHYAGYLANWTEALSKVGNDPLDKLIALIEADFSPKICNPESLSVWFAFWGEQKFTPQYAEVSAEFDIPRAKAMYDVCVELMPDEPQEKVAQIADWIDTLTDGYWQRIHLSPKTVRRKASAREALEMVARLLPEHSERLAARI